MSHRYTEDQKMGIIKIYTNLAMSRTFATDRIILENWKPIPEVRSPILIC